MFGPVRVLSSSGFLSDLFVDRHNGDRKTSTVTVNGDVKRIFGFGSSAFITRS